MSNRIQTIFKAKYIGAVLHLLIWSAILLLPYLVSNAASHYRIGPLPGAFFTITGFIHAFIFYFNAYYLFPRLLNKQYWWAWLISAVAITGISFRLKFFIAASWFPEILHDKANYRFIFGPSVFVLVISTVYSIVRRNLQNEKRRKEREASQWQMELKFLRSQISPHFIFNILTNLVSLARKKSDQLENALLMLSGLMRYMLYDSGKKISLEQELEYLNSYIALQNLRFGKEVTIHSEIDLPDPVAFTIEPMLLIPFVENAFKHGTGVVSSPFIHLSLRIQDGWLWFEVENKFDPQSAGNNHESSGIGIVNVQSRLKLLYPGQHQLTIASDKELFNVKLRLQLL